MSAFASAPSCWACVQLKLNHILIFAQAGKSGAPWHKRSCLCYCLEKISRTCPSCFASPLMFDNPGLAHQNQQWHTTYTMVSYSHTRTHSHCVYVRIHICNTLSKRLQQKISIAIITMIYVAWVPSHMCTHVFCCFFAQRASYLCAPFAMTEKVDISFWKGQTHYLYMWW